MSETLPTMPEGGCHLCWLSERFTVHKSKEDLCLAMAFNLGRLMEIGLTPKMCNTHVELIQRQLGNLQDAIDADPVDTTKALDS